MVLFDTLRLLWVDSCRTLDGRERPIADAPKLTQVTGSQAMTVNSETRGRIVETYKDGSPILWTYVPEMPEETSRRALPWLTVVRWEYDGSENNGMPDTDENQRMLMLEAALLKIERPEICVEAYRRIGAGLREFVYYIVDRELFLEEFNEHVAGEPRYPIEIKFYQSCQRHQT